jgi:hypothetical protein
VGYGLPPIDYMRRSDFPRMARWQKVVLSALLLVEVGVGVASAVFFNFAEVMGVVAAASVLFTIVFLAFLIRRSRPAKKAKSPA